MSVSLQAITKPLYHNLSAEEFVTYIARVSNPSNQLNTETAPRLLNYLINHKHWSPFEHVSLTYEIKTTRAIAAQILRHRSFTFQEFSQRYASDIDIVIPEMRKQANKNRQGSDGDQYCPEDLQTKIDNHLIAGKDLYDELIENNIAKETARFILPLCSGTTIYMSGTLRSFIHYIQLRTEPETQKEHREIALAMIPDLREHFPILTEILGWN